MKATTPQPQLRINPVYVRAAVALLQETARRGLNGHAVLVDPALIRALWVPRVKRKLS